MERNNRKLVLLAGIAAMGSMAIHMLVPALPMIAADFAVGPGEAQHILGFYLFFLGAGQLVAGQFVDRIGRRPVLLAGLMAYTAGAFTAFLAPSLSALLAARVLQAAGGAAGVVTARVIVSDDASPGEGAARQATLMMVVLISPALSPVVGGLIASSAGWRGVFVLLALAGLFALAAAWIAIAESRPGDGEAMPARSLVQSLWAGYHRLLTDRAFLGAAGALAAMSSALYIFLANAPFLLESRYGLSPDEVGIAFLFVAVGGIAGSRLVALLERRTDALVAGVALGVTGSVAALAGDLSGLTGPAALIAPLILLGVSAGVAGPAGIGRAIAVNPSLAGTAASLAGAGQMLISSLAITVISWFSPVGSSKLCIALVIATAIAAGCAALARPRETA
ncbi:MFS transporter [Novosphingobium sp. PP1Y]|uniref:MFS transporter n=1 Tax=Novosphingobium sp. PP1Y TaxID=702113 RepID=UPI00020EFB5B|nr:MFS transporter [Novosphingobium sp. PP1Y]CCA90061.1 MFS transporter, DHA1 family,bicyclomycin/chloramphenicol resistance protein [Novosphingobium sp. PP1Y]